MRRPIYLALACLSLLHFAPASRAQDQFEVSYWLGPPEKFTTLERYQEIKGAGFTIAFPPLHTPSPQLNRKILDLCEQVGLKAMIADARMVLSLDAPDARAKLDAIVKDYADHPALYGYFVVDEPDAAAFKGLADVVAYLKQKDPKHPGFINLFPTYSEPSQPHYQAKSYQDYVERFVSTVHPAVLSYDHYPFIASGDRPQYFQNLAIIRNAAIGKLPFWQIALCVQHYDYRHLTEGELRFQAMQTLAFGGRGLLWYTYWYPGEPNETVKHAMINHDGSRDPHYDMIKAINDDAKAIGTELLPAQSWATYHVGAGGEFSPPADLKSPISVESKGKLTIGLFRQGEDDWLALIANRDYTAATTATITGMTERFDVKTKRWSPVVAPVSIDLPSAGAVLLRSTKK